MNRRILSILGLIVILSFLLGFFSLTRGHPWWDDFAGYLLQAKSILSMHTADFISHNTFTIQNSSYPPGPVAYPWGYPLLLAPVYAIFGLNPLALKLVSLAFFALFLISTFFLARTRLDEVESLLVTGVLAFAPAMILANDLILSDIPFLAISTASLVTIERLPQKEKLYGGFAGLLIFMAFFLRTNGILLLAPLLAVLLLIYWPNLIQGLIKGILPVFIFLVLFIFQAIMFPGGQSSYFSHFSMFSFQGLLENLLYYLWLPSWAFEQIPGGELLYPLFAVFFFFSLVRNMRRDVGLNIYCLLTFLVFILWPERQGLRFIYPVLPVFFLGVLEGMKIAVYYLPAGWQIRARYALIGFWSLLMTVCLSISAVSAYQITAGGREINGPFDPYSREMYSFIIEKTPSDSVFIFMRPRALRLFTERDAFMTENCSDLNKGNFVVIHQKMEDNGQISPAQVTSCNSSVRLEEVFRNKRFIVFHIDH